jgi:hypothetical protein
MPVEFLAAHESDSSGPKKRRFKKGTKSILDSTPATSQDVNVFEWTFVGADEASCGYSEACVSACRRRVVSEFVDGGLSMIVALTCKRARDAVTQELVRRRSRMTTSIKIALASKSVLNMAMYDRVLCAGFRPLLKMDDHVVDVIVENACVDVALRFLLHIDPTSGRRRVELRDLVSKCAFFGRVDILDVLHRRLEDVSSHVSAASKLLLSVHDSHLDENTQDRTPFNPNNGTIEVTTLRITRKHRICAAVSSATRYLFNTYILPAARGGRFETLRWLTGVVCDSHPEMQLSELIEELFQFENGGPASRMLTEACCSVAPVSFMRSMHSFLKQGGRSAADDMMWWCVEMGIPQSGDVVGRTIVEIARVSYGATTLHDLAITLVNRSAATEALHLRRTAHRSNRRCSLTHMCQARSVEAAMWIDHEARSPSGWCRGVFSEADARQELFDLNFDLPVGSAAVCSVNGGSILTTAAAIVVAHVRPSLFCSQGLDASDVLCDAWMRIATAASMCVLKSGPLSSETKRWIDDVSRMTRKEYPKVIQCATQCLRRMLTHSTLPDGVSSSVLEEVVQDLESKTSCRESV